MNSQDDLIYGVKAPDGTIWDIPESGLDAVMAQGGVLIDNGRPSKMIAVQAPDGTIWDIPELRVDEVLEKGGGKLYDDDSLGKKAARSAKSIAAGAIGGTLDVLTAPYNIPATLHNTAVEATKDNPNEYDIDFETGMPIPKSGNNSQPLPLIPSAAEAIKTGIDDLTGGYTATPESAKSTQNAIEMASSVVTPGGLAKKAAQLGAKGVSKVLGAIGTTSLPGVAGAGAAGYAASEAEQAGYGPLGSIGAGLGAGVATGATLAAAKALNAKIALANLTGNSPKNINLEAVKAAEDTGMDFANNLVNEGKVMEVATQIGKRTPIAGSKYAKMTDNRNQQFASIVDESIDKVGRKIIDSDDAMDVGKATQEVFQGVEESLKSQDGKNYSKALSFLPDQASIVPQPLIDAIKKVRNGIKTLKPSSDEEFLINYLDEVENKIFMVNKDGKTVKLESPSSIPIEDLIGSKRSIDRMIKWSDDMNIIKSKKDLKEIRYAYKKSIEQYAKENPEFYKAFREAEDFHAKFFNKEAFRSKTVQKILSEKDPHKITYNMRDVSDFENIQRALGNEKNADALFNSLKREKLSQIVKGQLYDNSGEVSYSGFTKSLKNKSTRDLVKYLAGDNYDKLISLNKYAENVMKMNKRNPNPSGTAPTQTLINWISYAIGGTTLLNPLYGAGALAASAGLDYGLSWLINNKKILNWSIEAAKKRAAGNIKDSDVYALRISNQMKKDLGEDFYKQFIHLAKNQLSNK